MKVADFLSPAEERMIVEAIKEAERNTSGEIRVHLESRSKKELPKRAAEVFNELEMQKTELRNGVLFYVAVKDKTYAIIGDKGINDQVPDDFWVEIKDNMLTDFKSGNFGEGIAKAIIEAGKQLKVHFPYQKDDVNELSDDISIGD